MSGVIMAGLVALFYGDGREPSGFALPIIIAAIVGCFVLTYMLATRNPNLMKRILKMKYDDAEFLLRMVFKEEGMRFRRDEDAGVYVYTFPGRDLTLYIFRYDSETGHAKIPGEARIIQLPYDHTLVEMRDIGSKSFDFAEKLASAIDQKVDGTADKTDVVS